MQKHDFLLDFSVSRRQTFDNYLSLEDDQDEDVVVRGEAQRNVLVLERWKI